MNITERTNWLDINLEGEEYSDGNGEYSLHQIIDKLDKMSVKELAAEETVTSRILVTVGIQINPFNPPRDYLDHVTLCCKTARIFWHKANGEVQLHIEMPSFQQEFVEVSLFEAFKQAEKFFSKW